MVFLRTTLSENMIYHLPAPVFRVPPVVRGKGGVVMHTLVLNVIDNVRTTLNENMSGKTVAKLYHRPAPVFRVPPVVRGRGYVARLYRATKQRNIDKC